MFFIYHVARTQGRKQTFYDGSPEAPKGICHIPMNEPFCKKTREVSKPLATAKNRDFLAMSAFSPIGLRPSSGLSVHVFVSTLA